MQHLVKNNPHTPHITAVAKLLSSQNFGSCIKGSPQTGQFLSFLRVIYHSAEPKIAELGNTLFQQNVGGLDVSMDDLPLKKIRVSTNEMPHEGDGFSLTESFCCSKLVKVLFEVAILAELEDNVKVFPTPEAVVHFAYEGG